MNFGLGYLNVAPAKAHEQEALAASLPHQRLTSLVNLSDLPDLATPSHVHLRGSYQNQRQGEACVAFALSKSAWRSAVLLGDEGAEVPSPLHIWVLGRRALSGPDVPLENRGTYPRLVRDAVRACGLVAAKHYPYDEAAWNLDIPPRIHRLAYDASGLDTFEISEYGQARLNVVRALLRTRVPVMVAMEVDSPFLDFTGDDIIMSMDANRIRGNHMMNVLAVEDDDTVIVENSWGPTWGITSGELIGCCRMSRELFLSEHVLELVGVRFAPGVR